MKNKIIALLVVVGMFMAASCGPKKSTENQEAVKSDSTVVKSDSTVATTPKDSVKSK